MQRVIVHESRRNYRRSARFYKGANMITNVSGTTETPTKTANRKEAIMKTTLSNFNYVASSLPVNEWDVVTRK